jgi:hypothetical protein
MPPHQQCERSFIVLADEALQELTVAERTDPLGVCQMLDVPEQI